MNIEDMPPRVYTDEDRRRFRKYVHLAEPVAYHEAGHAVAAEALGVPVIGGMHVAVYQFGGELPVIEGQVRAFGLSGADDATNLAVDVAGQSAEKLAGLRKRYNWKGKGLDGRASDGEVIAGRSGRCEAIAQAERILRERWHEVVALAETILDGIGQCGIGNLDREQMLAAMASGKLRPAKRFPRPAERQ